MKRVLNMTPHQITIQTGDGRRIDIPPAGKIFRLAEEDQLAGTVSLDGVEVEVVKRTFEVTNCEELLDSDAVVIVSLPALMALRQAGIQVRAIVVAPDTGATAIRDERGQIVAVRRFITM